MKTVCYMRLSREDGDDESSSISNQRRIINEYAKANNITIDEEYTDDGVSGYSMDRPAFNKLKEALNQNKVDTIIVKDLSRLGRHNAKVNLFLENIIDADKCLIAINDNYHSYSEQANDILGIQTWVNEKYVKDTSKKVRKSIRALQAEGRYISSVPYGYKINPNKKNDYMVDQRTAKYVKMAFDMYINGDGFMAIVRKFTAMGVPTQTMIESQDIEASGRVYRRKVSTTWSLSTLQKMLMNDFYIGTLTLNKTRRRSINGKKVKQDKSDLIVFPNHHEPIIDLETFNLAQEIRNERQKSHYRGTRYDRPNIFSGIIFCARCGERLTSTANKDMDTRYLCSTYNRLGTQYCSNHAIRESELLEGLTEFLESCFENLDIVLENLDDLILKESKNKSSNDYEDITTLNCRVDKLKVELQQLFEQKMKDSIEHPEIAEVINENYSNMITQKGQMIKSLELQIADMSERTKELSLDRKKILNAKSIFQDIINGENLTKKQIRMIVDRIDVHEDGGLDIRLKGDLHDLTTKKVNYKTGERNQMIINTIEYLYSKEEITYTGAWKYITRVKGQRISFDRFKNEFFKEFIDKGYFEMHNRRLELLVDKQTMYDDFGINTVYSCSSWLPNNNVILRTLKSLITWSNMMSFNKNKQLF